MVVLFIALAIAKFTVPGSEKLKTLGAEKEAGTTYKVTTMYSPGSIFSMGYVYYNRLPQQENGRERLVGHTDPISGKIIYTKDTGKSILSTLLIPEKTEKYLGLFGTYWKL